MATFAWCQLMPASGRPVVTGMPAFHCSLCIHLSLQHVLMQCWMAEDFPMSLKQLLPLMEVVGEANKHLARIAKFMAK